MTNWVVAAPTEAVVRGEEVIAHVSAASSGPDGRSAYRVAVDGGFQGTEAEWLATLPGAQGLSAYDLAVQAGFEGSEAEWRSSLDGAPGKSAYQLALDAGFVGSEAQWRASLQGATGPVPQPVPKLISDREYTLVAGDLWKTLIFNNDYSVTVWIPAGLPDFTVTIVRNGLGTVSVRPALGSTVNVFAPGDKLALGVRYESAVLRTLSANVYVLKGADIAAPAYNYPITGLALTSGALVGGSPAGTYIGQLLPADIDSSEVFTYAILAPSGRFALDGDKLTAGATATALTGADSVTIRVTDSDHHTFDQVFAITLKPFYGADATAMVLDWTLWRAWNGTTQSEVAMSTLLDIVRATPGWAVDSQGNEKAFLANEFRHTDQGLLIERAVTNLFALPDAPVTQTIAGLTAGAFVISMKGAGSIAVTGAATGNGAATEVASLRVTLTAAGSLTLTLSGVVGFVQVEKLPSTANTNMPASPVHGAGAINTRAVDVITMKGALLAAMTAFPRTELWEWVEPTLRWGGIRRLYRGSGGTQTMTANLTASGGVLNGSFTATDAAQVSMTTNAATSLGVLNRAFIATSALTSSIVLAQDQQVDPLAKTPTFSTIAGITLGSRNDTNLDPFNGYLRRLVIYPRRLANAEMLTPVTTDLPVPDFVTYPAIEPTGGAGGATYTATTMGYMQARLLLANSRKVVIDPSLVGPEPYAGTVTVKTGGLSLQGHPLYYGFRGGGLVIGDDTHMPANIRITDFQIGAGNGDFGRNFDDRDCMAVWSGDTILVENCVFWASIDECFSVYKGLANARGIRNIRFRRCIFGPGLYDPKDGSGVSRKTEVPHNMGLLLADGMTNIVVEECLFPGNSQRNPVFGVVFGGFAYNNLVYDWMQYGLLAFEQVSQFEVRGTTIAYVNNLLKPGPNTNASAIAAAQALLRIGDGSGIYFAGTARTDGVNFANDVLLNGGTDVALFKGADRRSLTSSMPFGTPYVPLPTATAADRQALYNRVLDNVGTRARDGAGNVIPGDAAASPIARAIIQAVRNGTSLKINDEKELTAVNGGYPLA